MVALVAWLMNGNCFPIRIIANIIITILALYYAGNSMCSTSKDLISEEFTWEAVTTANFYQLQAKSAHGIEPLTVYPE